MSSSKAPPALLALILFLPAGAPGMAAPSIGDPVPQRRSKDPTYGFTETNPIRVGMLGNAWAEGAFLNALRGPLGEAVSWERKGSCCFFHTFNGALGLLDRYVVTYEGHEKPFTLYLDLYDYVRPLVPVGFTRVGQPHFEPLHPESVFPGCGCRFSARPGSAFLFSSNYEGTARVGWNGSAAELAAQRPDTDCRPSRVGGDCTLKYRGADLRVDIKARATWVCAGDSGESCEVVRLSGLMTGRAGDLDESIEVVGECGC